MLALQHNDIYSTLLLIIFKHVQGQSSDGLLRNVWNYAST